MTWLDALTLETVIVHTTSGQSFKGLKKVVHDDCIMLGEVVVLEPEAQTHLDGDIVIPREQVAFMQLVKASVA